MRIKAEALKRRTTEAAALSEGLGAADLAE
jgi:hypothetical protein